MMDDRPDVRHEPATVARADDARCSDDEDSDGDFEFPFVSGRDGDGEGSGAAPADELFAGGRIRAFYPVFGRILPDADREPPSSRAPLGRLFQLEKARTSSVASSASTSSSSSGPGDLDAASPDSYCLWTPGGSSSPSRPRKSGSTGSTMSRWRRIGDLVVGRSHSDGRDKFLFLSAPPSPARGDRHHTNASSGGPAGKAKKKQQPANKHATEPVDTVAAGRRMSSSYGGGGVGTPGARRTFLPYRQDLVGLFANVHGLGRSHQRPF